MDKIYIPEMASLLNITDAALRTKIQRKGDIPQHKKIGSRIVWTRQSYQQWLTLHQPQEKINDQDTQH